MKIMKIIDIHTHGGFNISFDNADANSIKEFATLAYKNGIVGFCPTLTGGTVDEMRNRLENIKTSILKQKNIENESLIIGANLEGTFLSPKKSGVQNPDNFMEPTVDNFKKIAKGYEDIIKIVVIAPENNECYDLIRYLKSKNIKVHIGHTISNQLREFDGVCHLYNAMNELSHRHSTLPVRCLLDKNIYTELIADTIHVNEDILKLTFKTRPINKILLISDSLPIAASELEYAEFCGKKVYKTGLDEKGTLGGSVNLLSDIVQNLIKKGIITETEAEIMAYKNQADYLKLMV